MPEIFRGEIVALIGKNGVGKSIFLKNLIKLICLKSYSITFSDKPLHLDDVGYLPQFSQINASITVADMLITSMHVNSKSLFTKSLSVQKALSLLESIGIINLANRSCNSLSGGESQMVGLAQALINKPKVLIFDEPTSALDMNNQIQFLNYVKSYTREQAASVIMVLHDLNLAIQYSDKVAALHDGVLLSYGEPDQVIDRYLIKKLFKVNSKIIKVNGHPVVVLVP